MIFTISNNTHCIGKSSYDLMIAYFNNTILLSFSNLFTRFLEAGSDIIETNSYQASISALQKHANVTEKEAADIISGSAKLACRARDAFLEKNKDTQRYTL